MRFTAVTLLLAPLAIAAPLLPHQLQARAKSYSIVNVDGGSAIGGIPETPVTIISTRVVTFTSSPTTVNEPAITITIDDPYVPPATETIRQTVVVTPSETPPAASTSVVTFIPPPPPIDTAASTIASTVTPSFSSTPTSEATSSTSISSFEGTSTLTALPAVTIVSTAPASVITVIQTVTPSATAYYDDGMWHTLYPIKPTAAATSTTLPVLSTGAPWSYNTTSIAYRLRK